MSSCQSQMVCLGQDSWDMCESHHSVTVQRIVSGLKSEQASNVYLFTQVQKAGKAILSEVPVNIIAYSPIHVP